MKMLVCETCGKSYLGNIPPRFDYQFCSDKCKKNKINIKDDYAEVIIKSRSHGMVKVLIDLCDVPLVEDKFLFLKRRNVNGIIRDSITFRNDNGDIETLYRGLDNRNKRPPENSSDKIFLQNTITQIYHKLEILEMYVNEKVL